MLSRRPWAPGATEDLVQSIAAETDSSSTAATAAKLHNLIRKNQIIHEQECFNLNPATNVMNPKAEAALASRMGTRPSLGYPGAKYEMGLEAIEQIEVIAAALASTVFRSKFAEVRVHSGAMANLYSFMACTNPGDTIIAPPATIAGHVTHHDAGIAGRLGLNIVDAPVDNNTYTVDVDVLRTVALREQPKMITIGSSLNLFHHPVSQIREIADLVGAKVLFDAAHLSGPIAGGAWPNPLDEGAHIMTMSTYKSLSGPPSGLLVTNDSEIAERVDAIAYPGMTANFDAAKTTALAITLLDWIECGSEYATTMCSSARALSSELLNRGVPIFASNKGLTRSHAFAVDASQIRALGGNGQELAVALRSSNLLSSGIGLPNTKPGSPATGLRLGTNELVRWGMTDEDMTPLADLIDRGLQRAVDVSLGTDTDPGLPAEVSAFRSTFTDIHFVAA